MVPKVRIPSLAGRNSVYTGTVMVGVRRARYKEEMQGKDAIGFVGTVQNK